MPEPGDGAGPDGEIDMDEGGARFLAHAARSSRERGEARGGAGTAFRAGPVDPDKAGR